MPNVWAFPRSELFQRALLSFLQDHKDDGVTEKLDAIYHQRSEQAPVDPLLEGWQLDSLPKDEWS
ncbi:MAG: hypothetical protein BZY88_15280 [SAR202 cluster bacterium Io17-Chloro-G9]|nr:MAG: hypothetical protein BZY88_15280 [SAR202 cluster bacterium Io17-Chloro-G9]